jgi:hypothetical protein
VARPDVEAHLQLHTLQGEKNCTDKKENKIFLICEEIQNEAVAKSWLTASSYKVKYLRISSYIRKPFLIYISLQLLHSEFPYIWGKFHFRFFISVGSLSESYIFMVLLSIISVYVMCFALKFIVRINNNIRLEESVSLGLKWPSS